MPTDRSRPALVALALMLFCFLTSEVFAAGAMTPMSQDLHVPVTTIGSLVSVYAAVAAITILPMTALGRRFSHRSMLVAAVVVLGVAHVVMAATSSIWLILLVRALTALFHGPVWALAPLIATRLAPERPAAATAFVFLGASSANVAGAPLVAALSALHVAGGISVHSRAWAGLWRGSSPTPSP